MRRHTGTAGADNRPGRRNLPSRATTENRNSSLLTGLSVCLLFYCRDAHKEYPFILLANRDEFHERPTQAAEFWHDAPKVLGGRDLRRGGTWLGITRSGRWAALTNYREPSDTVFGRSRGDIVRDYLAGEQDAGDFAATIRGIAREFDGFNLLFGDRREALWVSNRSEEMRTLGPGIYGLSNHLLETPWPKVTNGKKHLAAQLGRMPNADRLFEPLIGRTVYEDALPVMGVDLQTERTLSSAFIAGPFYGTRSSSLIMVDREDRVYFEERTYDNPGSGSNQPDEYYSKIFQFRLDS
ncbi:MAG: hypothetical protein MAG794_01414 [Gammaproteobacteria bacterium]|nr:hypothetical protein [Gammaproteobacteria bacterium]